MRFARAFSRFRRCALGLAVAALAAGLATAAGADPPLWRVHGPNGGEVVLFGSVHLLTPGLAWRSPEMEQALAQAKSVWFEIPMDGSGDAAGVQAVERLSKLPKGGSLMKLLSPAAGARLTRVAAGLGLPEPAIDGYQPWFAEVTLTLVDLQRRGARQSDGVEPSLAKEAPATAERHAFETPEQQIGFIAGAPVKEQVASLEETLREMEEEPESFEDLQKAWLGGDTAWLVREAIEPLKTAAPAVYDRLVRQRNLNWAAEIERLLKTPDRAFIVVGIGHLVGPDSVPALLRRRGLKVEGP
jgi:uncharacterized protein YbaP (TraB family)